MSDPNFLEQAANLAKSAGIDTNEVIDSVSSHIPGGEAVAQVLKTGMDMVTSPGSSPDGAGESDNSESE
jgi:uncharacterized protein YidB (DUF937 family)